MNRLFETICELETMTLNGGNNGKVSFKDPKLDRERASKFHWDRWQLTFRTKLSEKFRNCLEELMLVLHYFFLEAKVFVVYVRNMKKNLALVPETRKIITMSERVSTMYVRKKSFRMMKYSPWIQLLNVLWLITTVRSPRKLRWALFYYH